MVAWTTVQVLLFYIQSLEHKTRQMALVLVVTLSLLLLKVYNILYGPLLNAIVFIFMTCCFLYIAGIRRNSFGARNTNFLPFRLPS